jgi:hypothetical protein
MAWINSITYEWQRDELRFECHRNSINIMVAIFAPCLDAHFWWVLTFYLLFLWGTHPPPCFRNFRAVLMKASGAHLRLHPFGPKQHDMLSMRSFTRYVHEKLLLLLLGTFIVYHRLRGAVLYVWILQKAFFHSHFYYS